MNPEQSTQSTWWKQVTAVIVTVSTLYAFTTITSAIHSIGPNLTPCNNEPCYAIRIFPDRHKCTTAGYYISVQNGVEPVRVVKPKSEAFWKVWSGWSIYEVGKYEETRSVSDLTSWLPWVYEFSWNAMFFVSRMTVKFTRFGLDFLFWTTGGSHRHVEGAVYCSDEGAEYFPPALCEGMTPEEMKELCNNLPNRKESFQGSAVNAFLLGLILWGLTMCSHDVLLLRGHEPGTTLRVGFLCLLSQCFTACAALWAAADGLGLFSAAPKGCGYCVCYFRTDDIQALLLLGMPCLLVYKYICFRKAFFVSVVAGDFLYNTMYSVPFAIVQSSPAWQSAPVLVPQHHVSLEQPLVKWKPDKDVLQLAQFWLQFWDGFSRICLGLSVGTLSTSLLPKAGQLLVSLLVTDHEGSAAWRFVRNVVPGLALHVPAVAVLVLSWAISTVVKRAQGGLPYLAWLYISAVLVLWPPDWSLLWGPISADNRHLLGAGWSIAAVYIFYMALILYFNFIAFEREHSMSMAKTLDVACGTHLELLDYKEGGRFSKYRLSLYSLKRRDKQFEKDYAVLFQLEDLFQLARNFPDGEDAEDAWKTRLLQWLSDGAAVELESPEPSMRTESLADDGESPERELVGGETPRGSSEMADLG